MVEIVVNSAMLREVLVAAAGEDEAVPVDESLLDTPFVELGFDSLAMLETASRVKRQWNVEIPDELLGEFETPRELLGFINDADRASGRREDENSRG